MRVWPWLFAAGCSAVFGLDEPTLAVTGTYRVQRVANDDRFMPIVSDEALAATDIELAVRLDDGSEPVVDYVDGTFRFAIAYAGQPYRLRVTRGGGTTVFQHDAPALVLGERVAGRNDALPQGPSTIVFPYPDMATAGTAAYVATTGVYSFSNTTQYGPTVMFDWRLASACNGARLGMLNAAKFDRTYAIEGEYVNTTPGAAYWRIRAIADGALTLVQSTTASLAAPSPVAPNRCAAISYSGGDGLALAIASTARTYVYTASSWYVYAAPAPAQLGLTGAQSVALEGDVPARNYATLATYYEPYPGTTEVLGFSTSGQFDLLAPGTTTPYRLADVLTRYVEVDPAAPSSCPTPGPAAPIVVGVPSLGQLAGVALDTDGVAVPLLSGEDAPLVWSFSVPGAAPAVLINLFEVTASGGVTMVSNKGNVTTIGSPALLDASWFEAGHQYIIGIQFTTQFPGALAGDYQAALPYETATTWSHYFTIR